MSGVVLEDNLMQSNSKFSIESGVDTQSAVAEKDIRRTAMDLLARREHSRLELSNKLLKRFSEFNLIQLALDKLEKDNLLSETRFVESYVVYRQKLGFGPLRIIMELKEKGINEALIATYLDIEAFVWQVQAEKVRVKKFGNSLPEEAKDIVRQQRFLQYRGFKFEHFASVLKS